jgi:plastocyanin
VPVASTPTSCWISAATLPSVGNSAGPFTGDAAASRDSPLPSPSVEAPGPPVIRTAPHLTSIAKASAKLPAESLGKSYPWAVGFFFRNTEFSLELWNIIVGILRFDDWGEALKRLNLIIPIVTVVLVLFAVGCGGTVAPAPNVDATVAAAVAATRTASDIQEKVAATLSAPIPPLGRYHQGRTLRINVMSIDRVPELRYSTIDPEQVIRRWRLIPSANDTELVLVRMKVENHTAVSAIVNVDRAAAEIRDFSNGSYFPLAISESVYRDLRGESEAQIRMNLGQCFDPNRVMIDTGTELEWTNEGDVDHFVQFNGAEVSLGGTGRAEIAPSESFSHTFGQAGAFDYNCGTTGSPPETAQVLVVYKSSRSGVRGPGSENARSCSWRALSSCPKTPASTVGWCLKYRKALSSET